jgi:excisionase family DNA binding protein
MAKKPLKIRDNYMALEWINALEAADYLNCCLSTVRKLTAKKEIKAHGIGGSVLYKPSDVKASIIEIN